jgi:hypothetical protein
VVMPIDTWKLHVKECMEVKMCNVVRMEVVSAQRYICNCKFFCCCYDCCMDIDGKTPPLLNFGELLVVYKQCNTRKHSIHQSYLVLIFMG